jgi:uncharacterized repeat protein (TIGR03803 family)
MHKNAFVIILILVLTTCLPSNATIREQVLHSFGEDDNGAYPISGAVLDAQGNLYGTTNLAGAGGAGTVFELVPAQGGWTYVLLHSFEGTDGGNPRSGVLVDKSGKLYGTTSNGGSSIYGTVYELTPNGNDWTFNVIHDFSGGADGGFPSGDLIAAGRDTLLGMTGGGGDSNNCNNFGCGTVFALRRNGDQWTEQVIYSFQSGADGSGPIGALTMDPAGNLYGVLASGQCQAGCGSVFRLHRTANGLWQKRTVFTFNDKKRGWFPNGGLTFDRAGNLYGTTSLGGDLTCNPPNGCGIVFKINAQGEQTVVHSFTDSHGDGRLPETGLALGPNGHLLGTTAQGGHSIPNCEFGCGTVFDVAPSGKVTIVYSFGGADGLMPLAPVFWDGTGHVYGTTFEGGTGFAGNVFELSR